MNTTSLVIKARPERLLEVIESLRSVELCEVHFQDEQGRIVVTLDGEEQKDIMDKFKQIQALPYVLGADLVFSYTEDEE